jgi:hypothetical protein
MACNLPADPFFRVPPTFDRESRVLLIAEVARALLEGRPVDPEAASFVGSALMAWLEQGGRVGSLEREFLKTCGKPRSRTTPARIWERCARTAQEEGDCKSIESSPTDEGSST